MIKKGFEIYRKHKEGIKYLFFGGLAFLVGMLTYWIPIQVFDMSVLTANVISWMKVSHQTNCSGNHYHFELYLEQMDYFQKGQCIMPL